MKKKLYALLVGIDEYPEPIPKLRGCVNDIRAISNTLEEIFGKRIQIESQLLVNESATREAIINGFRNHLSKASKDDTALFYFCGHGSQENVPTEFLHLEPDGLGETLVCWDSRLEGRWDLADKELGYLISEVARNEPHTVIIVDACHSGTVTRDVHTQRLSSPDLRQRPIESFIFSIAELEPICPENKHSWLLPPSGRHVLLAACRDRQTAKELLIDSEHHGVFTHGLMRHLNLSGGNITYKDLLDRTSGTIRRRVYEQHPQLEVIAEGDRDLNFITASKEQKNSHNFLVRHERDSGWSISCGAIHGVRQGANAINVLLYPLESQLSEIDAANSPAAEAVIKEVSPHTSLLEIKSGSLARDAVYKGKIIDFFHEPLLVYVSPEANHCLGRKLPVRQVQICSKREEAAICIDVLDDTFVIESTKYGGKEVAKFPGKQAEDSDYSTSAESISECLQHIYDWEFLSGLCNATTELDLADIEFVVIHEDKVLNSQNIELSYKANVRPKFQISMTNKSPVRLYCALFALSENFSITGLINSGTQELEPGQKIHKILSTGISDDLWLQGTNATIDQFKLLVCTSDFDSAVFNRPKLSETQTRANPRVAIRELRGRRGTFTSEAHKQFGGFLARDVDVLNVDEWLTRDIWITTCRSRSSFGNPQVE